MDDDYSWNGGLRGTSSFRLPENEGVGKWVAIAVMVAIILHAFAFVMLGRIDVRLRENADQTEIQTEVVRVNRVDKLDSRPELNRPEPPELVEPVPIVPPIDELDMLENMADVEIDISPEIEVIEVPMSEPAAVGELDAEMLDQLNAPIFEASLPDLGQTEDFFPRASESQVAVDPGAREAAEHDPDVYTEALRQGAEGAAENGLLKDFTSLDAMTRMDGNSLLATKALIGSDLLFDFNSATLRQSARISLMKVALLIDKHPDLVCWVDGHTDLVGLEQPNLILSQKRAMAVKTWLVSTLSLDESSIAVRGFGKAKPLVKAGDIEAQAPNRRVEIKMRRSRPDDEVKKIGVSIDPPFVPNASPARAVPVQEDSADQGIVQPPRAIVEPEIPPLKAILVEE
ncbi:MAG: OmpA family protein [Akkermansiaceae bacterium]|nr:OmpA family protein [Akkermansiaceae bacterium]